MSSDEDTRLVFRPDGEVRLRSSVREHEGEEGAWSPKLVRERLDTAIRLVQRTGGRVGPKSYGSAMPAYVHEWGDLIGQADEGTLHQDGNRIRIGATAAQISMMERCLEWPPRYCANEPKALESLNLHLESVALRQPFSRLCQREGWSTATAKRWRNKALSLISQGLTKEGVKP